MVPIKKLQTYYFRGTFCWLVLTSYFLVSMCLFAVTCYCCFFPKLRRPLRQEISFYCMFAGYKHTWGSRQYHSTNNNKIKYLTSLWKLMQSNPSLHGWVCPLHKHLRQSFQPLCTRFVIMSHEWALVRLVDLLSTVQEQDAPPKHKKCLCILPGPCEIISGENCGQ